MAIDQGVPTSIISVSALVFALAIFSGCARVASLPPQVTVAEIEPSGRAAKPPDCNMPVLRSDPLGDFRKIAIVEGVGNVYDSESDVLPLVQRKACETGADALVIVASKSQTSEGLTGYYINSVAIIYGKDTGETIHGASKLSH
ncbi:MAG TPA: hypothetical protein VIX12_03255 [Candidatus Binataceae bacterium]